MVHFAPWKIITVLLLCFMSFAYAAPNLIDRDDLAGWQESVPGWLPNQAVNLGLDLRGGVYLLLEVQVDDALEGRIERLRDTVRSSARRERIRLRGVSSIEDGVRFRAASEEDTERLVEIARRLDEDFDLSRDGADILLRYRQQARDEFVDNIMGTSVEVIRRRVDETGTTEPVIQRQGDDRILLQVPGASDPEQIKDVIGTTAQMTFHLVDTTVSLQQMQAGQVPNGTIIRPMLDPPGQTIAIRAQPILSGDNLVNANTGFGQSGPVVSFRFDSAGARIFGDVTTENVGRPFAILLDEQVISAPVIREPIVGGNGQISGDFSVEEVERLALLLRSGALPADIDFLEERTVGPSLGADSIAAGQAASMIGLILVAVFMVAIYGGFGAMATIALAVNMAAIVAMLSFLQATLTLPGIAGIVLTIGMAVDANVLILERIREEARSGRSPIAAIDAGYGRALTTIIDASLTTLIAAAMLYSFGSGPVKGFAVTLSIGILTSMFSAIMVTRLMIVTWLRQTKPSALPV